MQRRTGEHRQVRKEATVAMIRVCRRVPGHFCAYTPLLVLIEDDRWSKISKEDCQAHDACMTYLHHE